MAHITETHRNVLDGLRSTYDGDWPPGEMSDAVIGQQAMSITAEGNEALNPSVRWRRTDKEREIGAESEVPFVCVCGVSATQRAGMRLNLSEAQPFSSTLFYPHFDGRLDLVLLPIDRFSAEAARCKGTVDFQANPEIMEGYVSRKSYITILYRSAMNKANATARPRACI